MNPNLEVQIIAILVAISCSLLGVFLILKKQAMMGDAISHTVLLGIVIGFLIVKDLNSIILIIGAVIIGLLTVFFTETIIKTKIVAADAAIGLIAPFLFSIGIVLITGFTGSVHLDLDSVLLGELALAPFDRFIVAGINIGPKSLYIMGLILIAIIIFITLFFKELKITTFDPTIALILGFNPLLINYLFMSLVSVTAVSAFNAVGTILVIALMAGPPITAYLLTENLKKMLIIASAIGLINAIVGYQVSVIYDISIAGSIATVTFISFAITLFFNFKQGIITVLIKRARQKRSYIMYAMLFHLYNHENTIIEQREASIETISEHLNWNQKLINKMISRGIKQRYIQTQQNIIKLTDCGRKYALKAYKELIDSI